MHYKISVIVPVYNVEEYISECLSSCLEQNFSDFEVICINDGSTDNSLRILDDFEKSDARIKVFNQENKGLGAARNRGVELANGEYILFLDSDDWIEPNSLLRIVKTINEFNPDVILGRSYVKKDGVITGILPQDVISNNSLMSGVEFLKSIKTYAGAVWGKIWKRDYLIENDLRCFEDAYFEDLPLTLPGVLLASKVVCIDFCFYNYRIRPNSIIQQKSTKKHLNDFYNNKIIYFENIINDAKVKDIECIKTMYVETIGRYCIRILSYQKFDSFKIKHLLRASALCLQHPFDVGSYLFKILKKKTL